MQSRNESLIAEAGRICRSVAIAVIAGFHRVLPHDEIEERIVATPVREQALITTLVLGGMFAASLFAAQFGILGIALYLAAIVAVTD